jgi:ariadne-1
MMAAEDLRPEMKKRLRDVQDVLGVTGPAAGVLLRAYNWSKENLLEEYMADSDKILKKHGCIHRCGHAENVELSDATTCPICYDEVDSMLSMPCGHAFCYECWGEFCANAIDEGTACVCTTCPQAGCKEVVTEEEFSKVLAETNPTLMAKFSNFQLKAFVESNPMTRWCPGAGCERVACATLDEIKVVSCDTCPASFCLVCGEEPHSPSICKDLAKWNEKCRNESETANWILANTKSCPKCVSRIEKNQGCNHMTCQRCKFEFCWICSGDWNEHGANTGGYYKCSRYSGNEENDQSDSARAKRDLDRYLHYYRRYHAHDEAENFARKSLKETENRMVLLQESSDDAKWSDVEFLKTANEQLVECRRVLKYTYVFAYYLDPRQRMQRERFEHHQEMLERFTENLSELSEKPLLEMDRTMVVNQTRVVDRFMKNVLKCVEEGMDAYD